MVKRVFSIIFFVNADITIFLKNDKNDEYTVVERHQECKSGNTIADNFETIFRSITNRYETQQYALVLGSEAKFTNTRVVYLWLQGEERISGKTVFVMRHNSLPSWSILEKSGNTLHYSREPSIGKN